MWQFGKGGSKTRKTVHRVLKGVTAALQLYPHRRQCLGHATLSVKSCSACGADATGGVVISRRIPLRIELPSRWPQSLGSPRRTLQVFKLTTRRQRYLPSFKLCVKLSMHGEKKPLSSQANPNKHHGTAGLEKRKRMWIRKRGMHSGRKNKHKLKYPTGRMLGDAEWWTKTQ